MRQRYDGTIQSSNTPTYDKVGITREDFNLYRCMITKVYYVDDPANITQNSRNPSTIYEAVILGGSATGQTLFPCRLASWVSGTNNYSERTLQASSKNISTTKLSDCDGDVVYVQFNQGHDAYPVIIACDKGLNDTVSGTTLAQAPRSIQQYNGVNELIDNTGAYTLTVKGGSASNGVFTPGTAMSSQLKLAQSLFQLLTAGGVSVKGNGGKIAIGTTAVELLDQITQILQKIIDFMNNIDSKHMHIGNLGYDTAPPDTATDFVQLGTDLQAIQSKINQIKGTF
jgi:hypothetical protein